MKTSNYFDSKIKINFDKFFDKIVINRIGRSSGFIVRKPQKITATGFLFVFISSCILKNLNKLEAHMNSISVMLISPYSSKDFL